MQKRKRGVCLRAFRMSVEQKEDPKEENLVDKDTHYDEHTNEWMNERMDGSWDELGMNEWVSEWMNMGTVRIRFFPTSGWVWPRRNEGQEKKRQREATWMDWLIDSSSSFEREVCVLARREMRVWNKQKTTRKQNTKELI